MNSIIQSGQYGLQQSYQRITEAAHNIATAPASGDASVSPEGLAASNIAQAVSVAPAAASTAAEKAQTVQSPTSLEESVLDLRRQQQVFNASASVVSVGQELVGTLLDDYS